LGKEAVQGQEEPLRFVSHATWKNVLPAIPKSDMVGQLYFEVNAVHWLLWRCRQRSGATTAC
jgi:hypothetical protein